MSCEEISKLINSSGVLVKRKTKEVIFAAEIVAAGVAFFSSVGVGVAIAGSF
jgi:hypothetical protein